MPSPDTPKVLLPSTLADAAELSRLFIPGAIVRSQTGRLFFLTNGPEQERALATYERAVQAYPEAACDGKEVQAPLAIRRAAREFIAALGLAVREEDEAGCRHFAQSEPPAPAACSHVFSQQEQLAFYQSIGVNPFSRSGRP